MSTNINNPIKEKNQIQEVYKNKAIKLLKICIGLLIFDVITYLFAIFVLDAFDFGLIFEIVSFIFVVFAINKMEQNDLQSGKRNTIIAMIPIGWLIIYDLINLLVNIKEVMIEVSGYYLSSDQYFYYLEPYLFDVTLVAIIVLLYKTYSSLNKTDGSKQSDNDIDTFYNKL